MHEDEVEDEAELLVFDPDAEGDSDLEIHEYDIVSSPNDFNVFSYFNFIESGSIEIPGFQRNYVWDIRKASKLIESILMGLPIPQIFLYESERNRFIVIDGQQRLMTLYYFMKGRFPKRDARGKLARIMRETKKLSREVLDDDGLFIKFRLSFKREEGAPSPYAGRTYESLGEDQASFQLRTIRNIMVKQVRPDQDSSSMFELFHRLNTGGVNLSQQEIRMSLYYGHLMSNVVRLNENESWRQVLGGPPDQRQKDVEMILRMFALCESHRHFKKPLSKFINLYCSRHRQLEAGWAEAAQIFSQFCRSLVAIDRELYLEPRSKRVSVPIVESAFVAANEMAMERREPGLGREVTAAVLQGIRSHPEFERYFTGKTTDVSSVQGRIEVARQVLG